MAKYIKVDKDTIGIPTDMPTMTRVKITRNIERLEERIAQEQERVTQMTAELKELQEMLKVLDKQ